MTVQPVTDLKTPIGEILEGVGAEGLLLEAERQTHYAVLPLDDDLVDYLLERSPRFGEACREIRHQMSAGNFRTHEEVRKLFEST
jgi:hypothetical protein